MTKTVQYSTDFFKNEIERLQPYAKSQDVVLKTTGDFTLLNSTIVNNEIVNSLSNLIKDVISFTPKGNQVQLALSEKGTDQIVISNTGINLEKVKEITNKCLYVSKVISLEKGTKYVIDIPLSAPVNLQREVDIIKSGDIEVLPYYKSINIRLKAYFKDAEKAHDIDRSINARQDTFIKKVNSLIKMNIDDSSFKVDSLAKGVALSRAQLFRKMKQLTNMSPSQYLLSFRLHLAKNMLQSTTEHLNVSEVCYLTGFESKSHFTRSFQKKFCISPSSLKQKP